MSNVIAGRFGYPQIGRLAEEIKELIYSRAGQMSLAEAVGALEIVKEEIIREVRGAT